jgi:hypothetical protein
MNCEHEFELYKINKFKEPGRFLPRWVSVKTFYCTKCDTKRLEKQEEYRRDQPDWF